MGALADHGTRRKTFLMTFSFIGSISTILFASITSTAYRKYSIVNRFGWKFDPHLGKQEKLKERSYELVAWREVCDPRTDVTLSRHIPALPPIQRISLLTFLLFSPHRSLDLFWFAGVLVIISNVAFGASWVLYYAFIPTIARDHPEVVEVRRNVANGLESWADYQFVRDRVSNTLSAHSMAVGYGAGVSLLIVAAGIAVVMGQTTYSLQLGIALTGVWWFCVSFFTLKYMPAQPGTPLSGNVNLFFYSWRRLGRTLYQAKSLKETFKYLISWFILSDGSSTIISLAIFMGKKKFLLNNTQLMVGAIIVPFAALVGTYLWLFVQRTAKLTSKQTLLYISALFCVVPIYVLIGFSGKFGLVYEIEIWPVLVYFGLMLGATQSFSRVLYASLIPKGKESEFFSLYGITDKSSSWLGPLITGAIIENNDTRWGFVFPLAMMVIPLVIISWVDVERGIKDAEKFSDEHTDAKDGL